MRPRESFFSWVHESIICFGERICEHLSWWGGLSGLISNFPRWSENLLNCYWQAETRPKHYIVIKWSRTPNHDSLCGFFGWFAKEFCESLAKVLRKQWRKRRCPWKPVAHTAPLQRQLKGTWWTMKLCYFLVEFSQHGLASMALHLPLAASRIPPTVTVPFACCLSASQQHKSGQLQPREDKHGVHKRFTQVFWAKNGRLQTKDLEQPPR